MELPVEINTIAIPSSAQRITAGPWRSRRAHLWSEAPIRRSLTAKVAATARTMAETQCLWASRAARDRSEPHMPTPVEDLVHRIRELEEALEAELREKRRELRYRLERSRVVFEQDVLARHRAARVGLFKYISGARLSVVATAPVIYALILPLVLLDLFVSLFHAVCFPVYGIEKVPRRDYVVIDRQQLAYLNGLQKLNCMYCGYANGVIGWVREIAARTEAHWCPIKHSRRVAQPHAMYTGFLDFGDEAAFRKTLDDPSDRSQGSDSGE
jgi:hypothetical protein